MITIANTPKDAARELARIYDIKLSFEALTSLASMLHSDRFRHRTLILQPDEISTQLYFVTKGLIRQYTHNEGEEDIVEDIVHEGNILMFKQCLFTNQPTKLYVQTLEPTILYGIEYAELKELANKWDEINQLLQAILEGTILKQDRRFGMIDLHPKDRYLALLDNDAEVVRRTPLKYIASYLRMAPETLSRVRNSLNR